MCRNAVYYCLPHTICCSGEMRMSWVLYLPTLNAVSGRRRRPISRSVDLNTAEQHCKSHYTVIWWQDTTSAGKSSKQILHKSSVSWILDIFATFCTLQTRCIANPNHLLWYGYYMRCEILKIPFFLVYFIIPYIQNAFIHTQITIWCGCHATNIDVDTTRDVSVAPGV